MGATRDQTTPNQGTPNPAPAYVPPPPTPSYSPPPAAPAYYGGPAQNTNTGYIAPSGPRKKHYFLAVLLTLLVGPLGLFYASKKGALIMLFLLFAVPIGLGMIGFYPVAVGRNPLIVLQYDSIMNPIYSICVFFSVIWSVVGVYRHNAALRAAE